MERNTPAGIMHSQAITGWLLMCDETEAGAGISRFSSGHQFKSFNSKYPGSVTMLLPLDLMGGRCGFFHFSLLFILMFPHIC